MSAVKMTVPKGTAETTVRYGGNLDQPVTYKPSSDGTVQVEREHLAEFLRVFPGATAASSAAETAVDDVTETPTADAAGAQAGTRRSAPPR